MKNRRRFLYAALPALVIAAVSHRAIVAWEELATEPETEPPAVTLVLPELKIKI
jgi:hypothetical protein